VVDRFEELIGDGRPGLARAFAAAYGLDRGQEALAEALAWAWEDRDRVLEMDNPGGYLYRVGQSRSRPRRWRKPTVVFPPAPDLGLPEIEPALPDALTQLSVRQRVCVALVVADEWTYQEVADLLGIGRSSVQSHVERALEKLRRAMGVTEHADL